MDRQTQKNLTNIVKNNYEEIADHYSETRRKHIWPELEKLTDGIKDGDKILDVGCGSGKLLKALAGKKINYLGIDISQGLIKNAKEDFPDNNFIMGDILDLGSIPEINFDYVFCIAVLQHIPGKDLQIQAMRQLKNKISKNGKIIITVWNIWKQEKFKKLPWKFLMLKFIKKNKMDFGDILFDWKNPQGERVSKRYYHAFRKCELKRIFKKAGLKIERIYKDKYNYYAILEK